MKHGSLFSGIGGFDIAAEWTGWENVFHCEWNEFGQRILKYYWPKAISYGDIKKTDFTIHRGTIDVLSGGFPCQPYSTAGKRKGTADDRHLWPQMLRAIREIQPCYVVGENVRGLTNWNGGLVFDQVQADLEAEGYEVLPFLLPACGINAPHRRDRIWFIAYAISDGYGKKTRLEENTGTKGTNKGQEDKRQWIWDDIDRNDAKRIIANTTSIGREESRELFEWFSPAKNRNWQASWTTDDGGWPTQSPIFIRDDGFPAELDSITISDWIEESNKGSGNAIVPQVAYQIFKSIEKYQAIDASTLPK